jgi:uncharacterized UPF0160 family protein
MQKITIVSHNGSFHADDVFGVAVLQGVIEAKGGVAEVVRTRDADLIARADYAVDVGGVWDAAAGRFDHHQKGFDGRRPSGVLYASAGLVWAAHGVEFVLADTSHYGTTQAEAQAVAALVDEELVQYLDMADTGAANVAPGLFGLSALLSTFNRTGAEERRYRGQEDGAVAAADARDWAFGEACEMMGQLLSNIVAHKLDELRSAALVREGTLIEDGHVLVLDTPGLSWYEVVCKEMPKVKFVLYADSSDQQWQVRTVPVEPNSFTARMDLPRAWAGLRDAALAEVTGVADAVFCHNGVFIAGAQTREGAIRLAQLALGQAA